MSRAVGRPGKPLTAGESGSPPVLRCRSLALRCSGPALMLGCMLGLVLAAFREHRCEEAEVPVGVCLPACACRE